MTTLTERTCMLTAIFVFRSNKAVKVKIDGEESSEPFWIPMSQIHNIYDDSDGEEVDYLNLDPGSIYLWRITGWIACKLFDCDGWEDLVDLDLSFLDCE